MAGVATVDVDVAAAEEDLHGLADAAQQVVGGGVDGADAVELGADEEGTFAVQGLGVVTLALLSGAGDGCTRLHEVEAGGAGLLGHPKDLASQSTPEVRREALPK